MRSAVKEAGDSGVKRERKKSHREQLCGRRVAYRRGRLGLVLLGAPRKWVPDPRVLQAGPVLLGAPGTQQNLLAGRVLRNRGTC